MKQNFTSSNNRSLGADETGFNQGNIDGCNPQGRQAWLWVAVTPLVTFFEIALTRCTQAAQNLLGGNFAGILNSDRHGAYNWVDLGRRQLCWAHLRSCIHQNFGTSWDIQRIRDCTG